MSLLQTLKETIKSQSGLYLISGQRHAQIPVSINEMVNDLLIQNKKCLVVASANMYGSQKNSLKPEVTYFDHLLDAKKLVDLACSYDAIFIHGDDLMELFLISVNLAERGHQVFYTVSAPSLMSSMRKILGPYNQHVWNRISEVLKIVMWQTAVQQNNDIVYLYEVISMNEKYKTMVAQCSLSEIEAALNCTDIGVSQETAMGLNQFLLQAIVRRKIDIKTAFLQTRNPDEFDKILKRVGV